MGGVRKAAGEIIEIKNGHSRATTFQL